VALNLEKFQDAVNRMDAISENVRQAVIERSREAFVELDQQIEEERSRTE
jgi:plastocyanin domain-containing protein